MTKDNEQYAYFSVTGDFDPSSITSRLSLEPTEQWMKGTRNERTHFERKFSRWSLESRLARSSSLEDHVRDVLEQTRERAEEIRQVGNEYTAYMQLVGWFHNDYPGFGLDGDIITVLPSSTSALIAISTISILTGARTLKSEPSFPSRRRTGQ